MSYGVRIYLDIYKLGDGMGGAGLAILAANVPGVGPTLAAGTGPSAQTIRYQQAEQVPGTLNAPTLANLKTAISAAATDAGNQISTADLAQIQAWATGGQ